MRLRSLLLLLAVLVVPMVAAGQVHSEAATAPPAPQEPAAGDAAAGGPAAEAPGPVTAEEEWLIDEDGKRYRIEELERGAEDWSWVGENQIRVRFGMTYDVVSHDEDSFRVKIYERVKAEQPLPEETKKRREAEKRELERRRQEAALSYRAELETVDRLTFEPFDRGLPRQGQWRNGFDVADMNGDGHPDIVFGAARKSFPARPNIFLGDGAGGWRYWREARFPALAYDYGDAAVADFNRDGHPDLALGVHLSGVLVLVGDGEGRFELWSDGIGFEVPGQGGDASVFSSRALEVTDWNGDGWTDLLALGEGPKSSGRSTLGEEKLPRANGPVFFLNAGNGSWRPKGYESKVFGDSLALGDFNGDGRLDFATSSNSPARSILNLGGAGDAWEARPVAALRPASFQRAVAGGRLDGDEIDDLVVGYVSHELETWRFGADVLYGAADLGWRRRPLFSREGKAGVYGMATGDLDGDGRLDVALATGDGEVLVFLADEKGFFAREASPELPAREAGCRGYGLRVSDLDGDGRGELIVSFAGEQAAHLGIAAAVRIGCPEAGSLRVWSSRPRGQTEAP